MGTRRLGPHDSESWFLDRILSSGSWVAVRIWLLFGPIGFGKGLVVRTNDNEQYIWETVTGFVPSTAAGHQKRCPAKV